MRIIVFILSCGFLRTVCAGDEQYDFGAEIGGRLTSVQVQESTYQQPDEKWITTALKDIAYYLRNYKFNEWDRRYYRVKPDTNLIGFFRFFPAPPLRTLHWKVYENCNSDFYKCIIYLHGVTVAAPFTRSDDIVTILNQKSRPIENYSIERLNMDCRKVLLNAENSGIPFDGPLEKFQWSTSASYYMCWYTMLGTPALSMLGESCDNFANCLEPLYGHHNLDIRSDDRLSFACATYSFCPDPCCPIKHLDSVTQCNRFKRNPCYTENTESESFEQQCRMNRKNNQNFEDIINNKWNISCHCNEKGFKWKSQFGMCVDINECITGEHKCDNNTEDCLNLPGTFSCICKWGLEYDKKQKKCVETNLIKNIETNYNAESYPVWSMILSVLNSIGIGK